MDHTESGGMSLANLRVRKASMSGVVAGAPWVMRHEAVESSSWTAVPPGSLARVEGERGEWIGIGMVNPESHIVCRMLSRRDDAVDEAFFAQRIYEALARRDGWYAAPYYRLVHAEADGMPGVIVDRFGDVLVIQVTSAGMERLQPVWLPVLQEATRAKTLLFRNDNSVRRLEGLHQEVRIQGAEIAGPIPVWENAFCYQANVVHGQKTGWFYDMRDNRHLVAMQSAGQDMLDVFSHSGGFGLLAAHRGARSVTMVDSSALALDLSRKAAEHAGISAVCHWRQGDAVEVMRLLAHEGTRYGVVVADPPAYVKQRAHIATGMKGYTKVAAAAAALVAPGGYFFTASCSHHASRAAFQRAILEGISQAGRKTDMLQHVGASRDHPLHPHWPQGDYLKGLWLRLA